MSLFISLGFERANATCWNGSVSSYYYTPVHSIFIGALVVIGVSLFTIRGATAVEEILLNMAGFLAPVVAFVPTSWSSRNCPSNVDFTSNTGMRTKAAVDNYLKTHNLFAKFTSNNLLVFIIGGVLAVLIAGAITVVRKRGPGGANRPQVRLTAAKELGIPALGSVLVVTVGLIWHHNWARNFNAHAHGYSASIMFVFVFGVMVSSSVRKHRWYYQGLYRICAALMALGAGGVVLAGWIVGKWDHKTLVLEGIEASVFALFWLLQTLELWDTPPGRSKDTKPLLRLWKRSLGRPTSTSTASTATPS